LLKANGFVKKAKMVKYGLFNNRFIAHLLSRSEDLSRTPCLCYSSRNCQIITSISGIIPIFALVLFTTGCATTGSQSFSSALSEEVRKEIHTVAVLPSTVIPKNNFLTYAKSRKAGATQGAAGGASYGALYMAAESTRSGPFGVLLLPYMAAAGAIVGGIAGGIEGSIKAIPADDAEKIEKAINHAMADIHIQDKIASYVIDTGMLLTEYSFNSASGPGPEKSNDQEVGVDPSIVSPDIVMEVCVTDIGFRGGEGRDPEVSFFMDVTIRLWRTSDGGELYFGKSSYSTRPQRFSEWSRNNATPLRLEFEKAYGHISEQVIENLFLIHDFHMDSMWSTDMYCMMKPFNPPLTVLGFFSRERITPKLKSRRPTFQWEAFPRDKDLQSDSRELLSRVSDISYDLVIWKTRDKIPTAEVYDKRGLVLTERVQQENRIVEHTIDIELESSTEYYWSVRARFLLDGRPRLTRWSYSRIPWTGLSQDPCLSDHIPLTNYYRFMTP
jgi:hypothetical protein